VKPAAGYRPLAYSSPEAVQTTGTAATPKDGARLVAGVIVVFIKAALIDRIASHCRRIDILPDDIPQWPQIKFS
jgi:hypothetical protein